MNIITKNFVLISYPRRKCVSIFVLIVKTKNSILPQRVRGGYVISSLTALLKCCIICCKNFNEFGLRKKTENSILGFLLPNQVFYSTNQAPYSFFTQNQLMIKKIFDKFNLTLSEAHQVYAQNFNKDQYSWGFRGC